MDEGQTTHDGQRPITIAHLKTSAQVSYQNEILFFHYFFYSKFSLLDFFLLFFEEGHSGSIPFKIELVQ